MTTPAFNEIAENFEFLEDWEDRYRYVIELGKDLAPLEDVLKVPATKVDGCASQVWLLPQLDGKGRDAVFRFRGESDAMIVSGLIAILMALYNNIAVHKVLDVDSHAQLARLGLDQHLSAQRSNGLRAMIERIRMIALNELENEQ